MSDILDDDIIPKDNTDYPLASKLLRFTNYLVDNLFIGMAGPFVYLSIARVDIYDGEENWFFIQFIISTTSIAYYTIAEYYFKGKTLGKIVTKTRAITIDNELMDIDIAFKRSISRVVPFEVFSFLGNMPTGWHDQWTDTKVIMDNNWKEEF